MRSRAILWCPFTFHRKLMLLQSALLWIWSTVLPQMASMMCFQILMPCWKRVSFKQGQKLPHSFHGRTRVLQSSSLENLLAWAKDRPNSRPNHFRFQRSSSLQLVCLLLPKSAKEFCYSTVKRPISPWTPNWTHVGSLIHASSSSFPCPLFAKWKLSILPSVFIKPKG